LTNKINASYKEKGWLYCSGLISDCPPGKPISKRYPDSSYSDWEHYACRQRTSKSHWHKIFETEEGKSVIEWDYIYYEGAPEQEATWSEEHAERQHCAKYHLCQSCKEPLKGEFNGEHYHTPYWIPLTKWYFWCTECWNKFYPEGHTDYACGRAGKSQNEKKEN